MQVGLLLAEQRPARFLSERLIAHSIARTGFARLPARQERPDPARRADCLRIEGHPLGHAAGARCAPRPARDPPARAPQFMSDIIPEALGQPARPLAFFSGPSFAKELVEDVPTAVTVAASELALAARVQDLFHHPALRICMLYTLFFSFAEVLFVF